MQETEYFIDLFVFQRPETKNNRKKGIFSRLSALTTLFFALSLLLAYPKTSLALTCGAPSVEGGMSTCSGGLNITFNPAQPQIGTQASISVSLKDSSDATFFKDQGATLQVFVVTPGMIWDSTNQIYQQDFRGSSVQGSFLVGGQYLPKAGNYSIRAEVSYQTTIGPSVTNYSFSQDTQLTVQAGNNTGGPSLTVTASESYADGPNINKGISWVYQDGGSGKQAASYKVDCGDGKGTLAVPSGQTSFRCTYTNTAKDYTATVYAYDAAGGQVLSQSITNSVTGLEQTQGAGSSSTTPDDGGVLWGLISKVVGFVLGIIQEIIYAIFYLLIVPIIQAVLSIHVYTDTFVSVIYPGWIVLRNLCNIIFIVAIMAIAIGTLLRVDSYKSRSVLVQLILAALLVNFSLVIAQIVLGIADTVQSQFLPNNQEVIRALGKDLMVAYRSDVFNLKITGYFSDIVKQFMFLILACGSFMVFLAIAAFLFIRMIMLWILLMLSPLAYAAGALPSTAHYRSEWWTTFLKYAFFTPIMAFFLNMTAIVSNTYKQNSIFGSLGVSNTDFGSNDLSAFIFRTGSTLLLIVFLIVALKVAESFSIFGAGEISKFAKKGMFAPIGAVKIGAGMAERAYAKKMANLKDKAEESKQFGKARAFRALQFLSPTTAKEAWKQRQHELHEEAFLGAVGDVRDTLNRVMPSEWNHWNNILKGKLPKLGRRTKYGLIGRRQLINIKKKEWENIPASEEEKVEMERQAIHAEDMEAWNLNLLEGRHEDGRMIYRLQLKRKEKADELFEKYKAQNIDERAARIRADKEVRDPENKNYVAVEYDAIRDLMDVYKRLGHHGKGAHELGRIAAHVDEEAEGQNKFRQMGFGVWEEHEGSFRLASDFGGYKTMEDSGDLGKLKMLEALHSTGTFTAENQDYEEVDLHDGSPPQKVLKQVRFKFKDENGQTQERVVKSTSDLDALVKETAKYSDESGSNLQYQLTGSRMAASRQKRIERGNFEDKIKGLEPASMMVMDEHGKFLRFTSSGAITWKKLPAMAATVLAQSRQAQARIMKFVGIYASEDEDKVIDTEKFTETNPDGVMYDVMAESFALNASAAGGVIKKAKIPDKLVDEMITNLQQYYDSPEGQAHFHGKRFRVLKDTSDKTAVGINVEQQP